MIHITLHVIYKAVVKNFELGVSTVACCASSNRFRLVSIQFVPDPFSRFLDYKNSLETSKSFQQL
jgi:hypothetical protein